MKVQAESRHSREEKLLVSCLSLSSSLIHRRSDSYTFTKDERRIIRRCKQQRFNSTVRIIGGTAAVITLGVLFSARWQSIMEYATLSSFMFPLS